jgi:hypothetical protein
MDGWLEPGSWNTLLNRWTKTPVFSNILHIGCWKKQKNRCFIKGVKTGVPGSRFQPPPLPTNKKNTFQNINLKTKTNIIKNVVF